MFEFLKRLVGPSKSNPNEKAAAPELPRSVVDVSPAPLTAAMNAFALDVWRRVANDAGNSLFSPGSLWLALAMTASGARGETRAQLAKLLRLPEDDTAVTQQLMQWNVENPSEGLTLRVVNRLFGQDGGDFEAAWREEVERVWKATFEALAFSTDEEAARRHINAWVEQQTAQKSRELLPAKSLTKDTRLVLVNAVYFLAKWATPFQEYRTQPASFFAPSGEQTVTMMGKVDTLPHASVEGAQVVALPYEGGPLELVVVLPTAHDGLPALEQTLTPARVEGWRAAAQPVLVDLSMPKFKLQPAGALALKQTLISLGVELAFDSDRADFTAISNPPRPEDRLVISEAFHQAFMRVDEEGTEAAAATAVLMLSGSAPRREERVVFRADHPFLIILRDSITGAWLFVGRVVAPSA